MLNINPSVLFLLKTQREPKIVTHLKQLPKNLMNHMNQMKYALNLMRNKVP